MNSLSDIIVEYDINQLSQMEPLHPLKAGIMNIETPQYASMNEVVMSKDELLQHLTENKAKHDVILATAIAGYWDTAQSRLETRKKKFYSQLTEYTADAEKEFLRVADKIAAKEELPTQLSIRAVSIDASLGLVYPQDHSQDYDRAIRMMGSSVFDKVRLSVEEYDAYVLNNWEWKANFLATNTFYVDTMRKKQGVCGPTGPAGAQGNAGFYARAANEAINTIQVSGLSSF